MVADRDRMSTLRFGRSGSDRDGNRNRIGTPGTELLDSGLRDSGMGLIGTEFRILESGLWEQAFGIVELELRTLESGLVTPRLGNESSTIGRAL